MNSIAANPAERRVPRVLYLLYSDILANVYGSQLAPLWRAAAENGVSLDVRCILSPRFLLPGALRRRWIQRQAECPVPLHAGYWGAGYPPKWEGVLERAVRSWITKASPDVVHARGPIAAGLAARAIGGARSPRLLFDVRGDTIAELRGGGWLSDSAVEKAVERVSHLEREACGRADEVLAVSEPLLERMRGEYGFRGKGRVVPCWAERPAGFTPPSEPLRFEVRRQLGIPDNIWLWCYAGSAAKWQALPETLALVKRWHYREKGHALLLLTDDPMEMGSLAARTGLSPEILRVRSGTREQVLRWMAAADAAILFREKNDINRVASPMKCGDYLLAGLPILLSEGIGDVSHWVTQAGAGVLAKSLEISDVDRAAQELLVERTSTRREEARRRSGTLFSERFLFDRYLPGYLSSYRGDRT